MKKIKQLFKAFLRKIFPPVKPISEQPEPEEVEDKDDGTNRQNKG